MQRSFSEKSYEKGTAWWTSFSFYCTLPESSRAIDEKVRCWFGLSFP